MRSALATNSGGTAPIFLHGISHVTGAPEDIATIDEIGRDEDTLATLTSLGLASYRRSSEPPAELAYRAVMGTLERARLGADQIDAVVYAPNTFDQQTYFGHDISRFSERAGLLAAIPIGVTLAECGNISSALRVGRGLIASGDCACVLVVTADVCTVPTERLVRPSITVMSDGAASCVLRSADAPSGLELLGVWQKTNPKARGNDKAASFIRTAKYTADGVAAVTRAAMDALRLTPHDVRRLITNNYNHSVLRLFATKSGFTLRDCFLDNVGRYGHVYAADNLINLDAFAGSDGRPGDTVLALSTGACTWGVAAVRIV